VLLFSPGFGTLRALYTAFFEELASRGFVVFALEHTYEAPVVQFPGGRLELARVPQTTAALDRAFDVRLADVRFVLDRLEQLEASNLPGRLRGRLDLSRVGMFGHSFGGAAAAEAMRVDPRIKAGANLDGSFYGSVARGSLDAPFMLMTAPRGVGPSENAFLSRLRGSQLALTLAGSDHFSFSDLVVLGRPLARIVPGLLRGFPLGSIDPARAIRIQRAYLAAFFSAHLRGTREPLLDRPWRGHPEVRFRGR